MIVRFDDAWQAAQSLADEVTARGVDALVVRNLRGQIALVVGGGASPDIPDVEQARLGDALREQTGPFCASGAVLSAVDLAVPEAFFGDPTRVVVQERKGERGALTLLERTVVGAEWSTVASRPSGPRVALYGFKGGVGRSTATTLLAQHLARRGQCVLVVDLDLESPGVGTLLLDPDQSPEHGLVDHLVESVVDNATGLDLVARSTLVEASDNGEVWVAPAAGRPRGEYRYLPKLNRVYLDVPPFADRLNAAVEACREAVGQRSRPPDAVLLDTRAGIHDIAAVAITRLSDLSLLFAVDNPHTWSGYRELIGQWSVDRRRAQEIRTRLRMVAAAVPSGRDAYLSRFRDNAQQCLQGLYDDVPGGTAAEDVGFDVYNPPLEDPEAPHSPLPIGFAGSLVGLDPVAHREWLVDPQVAAAFGEFLHGATDLIARGVE